MKRFIAVAAIMTALTAAPMSIISPYFWPLPASLRHPVVFPGSGSSLRSSGVAAAAAVMFTPVAPAPGTFPV